MVQAVFQSCNQSFQAHNKLVLYALGINPTYLSIIWYILSNMMYGFVAISFGYIRGIAALRMIYLPIFLCWFAGAGEITWSPLYQLNTRECYA